MKSRGVYFPSLWGLGQQCRGRWGGADLHHQAGFLASLVSSVINTHNLVTTHQQGSVSIITKEARGTLHGHSLESSTVVG